MAKTFTVNGKEYKAKEFDFNTVCDLEDMGVSIEDMAEKPTASIRAYFASCTGKGKSFAGKEMEQHFINGGSFDEIASAMNEEMEKSDFFRALLQTAEEENIENQSKKKKVTKV
jgi:hypothetical protein